MKKFVLPAAAFALTATGIGAYAGIQANNAEISRNQDAFGDEAEQAAIDMSLQYLEATRSPDSLASPAIGAFEAQDDIVTKSGRMRTDIVYHFEKIPNVVGLEDGRQILTMCDSVKVDLANAQGATVNSLFSQVAYQGRPLRGIQTVGNCYVPGTDIKVNFVPVVNILKPASGPTV